MFLFRSSNFGLLFKTLRLYNLSTLIVQKHNIKIVFISIYCAKDLYDFFFIKRLKRVTINLCNFQLNGLICLGVYLKKKIIPSNHNYDRSSAYS